MSASPLSLRNLLLSADKILIKPYFANSIKAMEARHDLPISNLDYPKPVSAPPPPISKDIELKRAIEASSKSSLFNLTRDHILYEDEWLMAVNKPKGVYCEYVLSSAPKIILDSSNEFHLANRLDRDTSGVMLITKSHKVAAKLVKAFTEHKIRKSYIALSIGPSPNWSKITVKSGHGRSKHGAWRVYAASDVGRVLPGGSFVRDMETTFELVSINGENPQPPSESESIIVVEGDEPELTCVGDGDDVVVVRAFPQSGRTHQIRLHCQYLGIPIRGDVKYHGMYEWRGRIYEGHELHAESLSLEHPVTGDPLVIQAALPNWANTGDV
ncbi:RNA pseudouridine synthase 1 [Raphanus sativus]|uniref:RNA pseudouridine synthase 1 n=1 Tax=Raphanus sativus TaxID=3726 RepID=A0A6J0LAN2_RAPSA|nr:RNA pseudouridine synthase 1 [Raphanus sativus]KAJ4878349.1 RNA pseudouridine synthase 1 [Raphanus sativus]